MHAGHSSPARPAPAVPTPAAPTPAVPTPAVPTPAVPTPAVPTPAVPIPAARFRAFGSVLALGATVALVAGVAGGFAGGWLRDVVRGREVVDASVTLPAPVAVS